MILFLVRRRTRFTGYVTRLSGPKQRGKYRNIYYIGIYFFIFYRLNCETSKAVKRRGAGREGRTKRR